MPVKVRAEPNVIDAGDLDSVQYRRDDSMHADVAYGVFPVTDADYSTVTGNRK